ncbi:MAG: DUF5348 domain-containing protein [Calothrix sp. SM1_5_4]|nr:DUF5348 domain-containing protein [Calothrix sp. SM1_5_4]
MNNSVSTLQKNDCGRWEVGIHELTSGSLVEIRIDGQWICGVIEYWQDAYYWFSRYDGIPVILHSGIYARLPNFSERRNSRA